MAQQVSCPTKDVARVIRIAEKAEQIDLDTDPGFIGRYVEGMTLE